MLLGLKIQSCAAQSRCFWKLAKAREQVLLRDPRSLLTPFQTSDLQNVKNNKCASFEAMEFVLVGYRRPPRGLHLSCAQCSVCGLREHGDSSWKATTASGHLTCMLTGGPRVEVPGLEPG